jgi:hypothetical protein
MEVLEDLLGKAVSLLVNERDPTIDQCRPSLQRTCVATGRNALQMRQVHIGLVHIKT